MLISLLKGGAECVWGRAVRHDQRGVAALVTYVYPRVGLNTFWAPALRREVADHSGLQGLGMLSQAGHGGVAQRDFKRLFAVGGLIGQAHTKRAEHAGKGMNQHLLHAKRVGHQTRVLATGATKALQGVTGDVVAARNGDFFNGCCHLLHRNLYAALRNLFGCALHLFGPPRKTLRHRFGV